MDDPSRDDLVRDDVPVRLEGVVKRYGGRTVLDGASDGDLEFAGQKCELRVQGAPLTQNFCIRTRVYHFVDGHTCQLIGGDVADAIAAGLNAVHVDGGQQVHHIG